MGTLRIDLGQFLHVVPTAKSHPRAARSAQEWPRAAQKPPKMTRKSNQTLPKMMQKTNQQKKKSNTKLPNFVFERDLLH
jgi:hypothetical protein